MPEAIPSLSYLRSLPAVQQPTYDDPEHEQAVIDELRLLPPLVFAGEVDELRSRLAQVADGRAFLLQGGDCAETFGGVRANSIQNRLRVLLSMAVVMTYAAEVPVVKVGRIAGQYAKPRSKHLETRGDVSLPTYRGDGVNGFDFTSESRRHDPNRLLQMYNASSATLNLVRAFATGGFADLRGIHAWNSTFVRDSHVNTLYEEMANQIDKALGFMVACGVQDDTLSMVDLYASHEALLMNYEWALTRIDSRSRRPYNTSGHLVWVGERNRQPDGAQIELLRTIRNPVGVKLGPAATAEEAVVLADRLDPNQEPGRLTIISRMGASKVRERLPEIVAAIEETGRKVVWSCDPMHGNTFETANGYKSRHFADVVEELTGFFDVHEELGTWPGGVHIELTGDEVTECLGGAFQLSEADLASRYETACDPRLNRHQSLELAFMIAERLNANRIKRKKVIQAEDWNV